MYLLHLSVAPWYFRDEPSPNFSKVPDFRPKSNWKQPPGHPCVELFLSKLEGELFSFCRVQLKFTNFLRKNG